MAKPNIDYTSKDYDGFMTSLFAYADTAFPEWKSRSNGDFGVLMVQMFSYLADVLSYYGDRIQNESYLATASERLSVIQLANMLGYRAHNGVPATGQITLMTSNPGLPVTVSAGTKVVTDYEQSSDSQTIFETVQDIDIEGNGGYAVVDIVQGETRRDISVGTSTGLPDMSFRLPHTGVLDDTIVVSVEGVNGFSQWYQVRYLGDAGPNDEVYTTRLAPDGTTWVDFGDGVNGLIPTTGLKVQATYRTCSGTAGNVVQGAIKFIYDDFLDGVFVATDEEGNAQSTATTGGADPESIEQIRINAPRAFRVQQRAVTLQDFEDLAIGVPSVSGARAISTYSTSVTVFIVGPQGNPPNEKLLQAVRTELSKKALQGVSVTVTPALPVPVNFGTPDTPVRVEVRSRFAVDQVKANAIRAITTFMANYNVKLGQRLAVDSFYREIGRVSGVDFVNLPIMARNDAIQTGTADINFQPWEYPVLGAIYLDATQE